MSTQAHSQRPGLLDEAELRAALVTLPGWTLAGGKLVREFRFGDFGAAFGFMTRAALVAERMDHHPEWTNVWNRVAVQLVTHRAKGITRLDVELARRMNELAGE